MTDPFGTFPVTPKGLSIRAGCSTRHQRLSAVFDLANEQAIILSRDYNSSTDTFALHKGYFRGGAAEYFVFPLSTYFVAAGIGVSYGKWVYTQERDLVLSSFWSENGVNTTCRFGFSGEIWSGYKYINGFVNYRFLLNTGKGENFHLLTLGLFTPIRSFHNKASLNTKSNQWAQR